jgi:hypothetical protein
MTTAAVVRNLRDAALLMEKGLIGPKRVVEELEFMVGALRGEPWVNEAMIVRDRVGKLLDRVAALRAGAGPERTNVLIDAETLLLDVDAALGYLEQAADADLGDALEQACEVLA